MNGRVKKIGIAFFTVLDLVLLLILMTWAWIEGTVTPGLEYSNMQISTAPGLVMKINGAYTEIINLNEYLSEPVGGLTLAEASSGDGKTIFFRTVSTEDSAKDDNRIYLRDEKNPGDKNTNYLSATFTLTASEAAQTIWLDGEKTYIKNKDGEPLYAVRMSLQVKEQDENTYSEKETKIMSMRPADSGFSYTVQKGVIDFDRTDNYMIDDSDSGNNKYMTKTEVYPLQDYSRENPWLTLEKDETVQVTMRVWLEGTDEACVDSIAGSSLDFHMYFDAAER